MKNKKWIKLRDRYIWLIIITIASITVGIWMIISPEKINDWIIRGVGIIWILDGISYGLDIRIKYLKN